MSKPYKQMNLWERVNDRQGAELEPARRPFEAARETIVEFFRPDLTPTIDDKGKFFQSTRVVNGDPAYSAQVMTRGVCSGMFSSNGPWRRYRMRDNDQFGDDNDIRRWLQQVDGAMQEVYDQRDSRYYTQMYRYLLGKFTVGSPVMLVEYEPGRPMSFTLPHHTAVWLMRDYYGNVSGMHLRYKMTAQQIQDEFEDESKHLFPLALTTSLDSGYRQAEYEIIQAFYKTDDAIFRKRPDGDVEIYRHRPWVCLWQLTGTDLDKEEPLRIRYYRSRPFIVGDWDLNGTEWYARSPAWHAMADTASGQSAWKSTLQLGELKAKPPIWAVVDTQNALKRAPGAISQVSRDLYQYIPTAFGHEGDYLTSTDIWERLNASCERWFFVSYFTQYMQMVARKQAPPTATQVIDMDAEKLAQLQGGIQGVETQDLWPIDDRLFEIMFYAGAFSPPPPVIADQLAGLQDFDQVLTSLRQIILPQFQGPLSQLKRLNTILSRVQTAATAAAPWFAYDMQSLYKIKVPELVELIFEESGVPQDIIRGKPEYEQIIQGIAEQQAKQQALAEQQAGAETVKALSGPMDRSSPLAEMSKG